VDWKEGRSGRKPVQGWIHGITPMFMEVSQDERKMAQYVKNKYRGRPVKTGRLSPIHPV